MADEGDDGVKYKFKLDGKTEGTSRGKTGNGEAEYPNGDKFVGNYVNGTREGKGVYRYANGDKYDGEWIANNKHGIGIKVY